MHRCHFPQPPIVVLLCISLTLPAYGQQAPRPVVPAAPATLSPDAERLPESLKAAVFQDIQSRWPVDGSPLQIVQAEPRLWSDGCLGLAPPGEFCQEVLVVGWQLTVARDRQQWMYRSNHSGGLVLWDQAGSTLDSLFTRQAKPIEAEQQPPRLPRKAVFREISSGGIAGLYRETLLLKNGQVLQRTSPQETFSDAPDIAQIPPEKVKSFRMLLKTQQFSQFKDLCYPAPQGSADIITLFLSSKNSTTCYADVEIAQLPDDLTVAIKAWNELIKP
ncbi:MAG: hypothetical protein ACFCU8_14215 [Thermosynechococcaceae cyanobacterium]